MLVLVGIPLPLVAVFGVNIVVSLIAGLVLLRTHCRRLAPFFFFDPTIMAFCAVAFAWPTAFLIDRACPHANYLHLMLGFPIGALFGFCVGFVRALLVRSRMQAG